MEGREEMNTMWSLISDSSRGIYSLAAGHLHPLNPWRFLCITSHSPHLVAWVSPWVKIYIYIYIYICWRILKIRSNSKSLWAHKFWKIYFREKISVLIAQKPPTIYGEWSKELLFNHTNDILCFGLLGEPWAIWIWTSQMTVFEGAGRLFSSAKLEWSDVMDKIQSWSGPGNTSAGSPFPRGKPALFTVIEVTSALIP